MSCVSEAAMFGWFAPHCPLNTLEKTWTEVRMRWLARQLGIDRLLRAEVVLPTDEYFPDPYEGTLEDARQLMRRLCGCMGIDPRKLWLETFPDEMRKDSLGFYDGERRTVWAAESLLADPQVLAATLAHELAHDVLLGGGLLGGEVGDHEDVTDLLPVFLGVGVFTANATIYEKTERAGRLTWWTVGKRGYLPARILGYAMALFAFVRGEDDPAWASHLRLDASVPLKDGLRYLHRTGDSLFHPDTVNDRRVPSKAELLARLQEGTPSARLAALWELREQGWPAAEGVAALTHRLQDRDPHIRQEAARVLAASGPAAAAALPELLRALHRPCPLTRMGAAFALGTLRLQPDVVVPELCALLSQPHYKVLAETARALARYGRAAEQAAPALLSVWKTALIACEEPLIDAVAGALIAVVAQPEQATRDYLIDDPDLARLALMALRARRKETPTDDGPKPIHWGE
jgi:hypothetical protein